MEAFDEYFATYPLELPCDPIQGFLDASTRLPGERVAIERWMTTGYPICPTVATAAAPNVVIEWMLRPAYVGTPEGVRWLQRLWDVVRKRGNPSVITVEASWEPHYPSVLASRLYRGEEFLGMRLAALDITMGGSLDTPYGVVVLPPEQAGTLGVEIILSH